LNRTHATLKGLGFTGRLLTGATYTALGYGTLRDPEPRIEEAAWLLGAIRKRVPIPVRDKQLVQANAAVQTACGVLLALGRAQRLSAVVLAGSMIPTTLAAHSFWKEEEPVAREHQQVQFCKNIAMIGGLLLAALDSGRKGH
jgi:putative oxidoreductase